MKNFNLQVSQSIFYENTFCVSRANHSYDYFRTEFNDIACDANGNMLLNCVLPREDSVFHKVLNSIKEHFTKEGESVGVALGTPEYNFFQSEYYNHFSLDSHHNLIVPGEDYPKMKR